MFSIIRNCQHQIHNWNVWTHHKLAPVQWPLLWYNVETATRVFSASFLFFPLATQSSKTVIKNRPLNSEHQPDTSVECLLPHVLSRWRNQADPGQPGSCWGKTETAVSVVSSGKRQTLVQSQTRRLLSVRTLSLLKTWRLSLWRDEHLGRRCFCTSPCCALALLAEEHVKQHRVSPT